jgi:hypothetical protein
VLPERDLGGWQHAQGDAFNGQVGESLVVVANDLLPCEQAVLGGGVAISNQDDVVTERDSAALGRITTKADTSRTAGTSFARSGPGNRSMGFFAT